jgi:FkbM family methyltransferase
MKQKKILVITLLFIISKNFSVSKDYLAKFLPENPIVIDAGAYDGEDTIQMSKLWPQGKIYAFEPVPKLFKKLSYNTRNYSNIVCIEKALSDKIGSFPIYISCTEAEQASSLLKPEQILIDCGILFPDEVLVEATTLDAWAKEMNIDHIDLLWFDLQGVEPFVLQASPQILETVKVVYTEVSFISLYENSPLYPEFKQWMEGQGFVVIVEEKPYHSFGNALFVRKELIK